MMSLEDMHRRYRLSRLSIIYGVGTFILTALGAPWPIGLTGIVAMEVCSYFATARRVEK